MVKKVRLVFWDGVPDVYNVDEGVGFDDRFKKNYRSYRKNLAFEYVSCVNERAKTEGEDVNEGTKKDAAVSGKMEKQIEKARRTAEKKTAKKGGQKRVDGVEDARSDTASQPSKKEGRTVLHFLPNLERVEIAYSYRNPSHFDMPDTLESRVGIYQDTNLPWKKQNRALLEKFLADGQVKVINLPGEWEYEKLNGNSWPDLEAQMESGLSSCRSSEI